MKSIKYGLPMVGLMLALSGCGPSDKPKKLTFALLVSQEAESTQNQLAVLTRYLTKKLGLEVVQMPISQSSAMIEAMRAKKIEVGMGGAFRVCFG